MNKKVIVLAGGKGTRMNAEMPKVLYPVAGQPMIDYLTKTLINMNLRPLVVVGFQAEKVKNHLGEKCDYVLQAEQLGTGHAVGCAKYRLNDFDGNILILYGDMPLVSQTTIDQVFSSHNQSPAPLTMATAQVEDFNDWREGFYSFGRILRDENNNIVGIKEKADCQPHELEIKEVNPSYFCFDSQWLWQNIEKLQTDNNQGELYLTDLVEIAFDQGLDINSIQIDPMECLGINTPEQLKLVEKILKKIN